MVQGRHERLFIRWTLRAAAGLLVALVVLMGVAVWQVYEKERLAVGDRTEAAARYASLTERLAELKEGIVRLDTPRGVEAELRERFPVARPGEEVIVLVDTKTPPGTSPSGDIWDSVKNWLGF